MESLNMNIELPVKVEVLFKSWLDSEQHSLFTGSIADIDPTVGGEFTAWDGYISGKTLVIETPKRILQSWRTSEFDKDDPDSKLELLFESIPRGTRLTFNHTNIPDGQKEMYTVGWEEYYFKPMLDYFSK